MVIQRHLPFAGVLLTLLVCAGCVANDDVVYVDEQGHELAVDASGRPILPSATPGVVEEAPFAGTVAEPAQPAAPPPFELTPPRRRAAGAPRTGAAAAAGEDVPPAGPVATPIETPPAVGPTRAATAASAPVQPTPAKKAPAKKIDSSSALDLPPAG